MKTLLFPAFRWCLFSLCISASFTAQAQFVLLGDADYMSGDCIQLTPDVQFSRGIAYHETKVDLSNYFEIEFDIYLGDKDEDGADGIVFVMHNDERGYRAYGTWGECMSYGRWDKDMPYGDYISPSVAVEFDTYSNFRQNDPTCDHAAFLENGTNYHEEFWNDENPTYNLEDDQMHNFRFKWIPSEQQIAVYLDNNIVYQGTRDLINDIFKGESQVIWGFTASTGRKHNLQYFCLRRWVQNQDAFEEKSRF